MNKVSATKILINDILSDNLRTEAIKRVTDKLLQSFRKQFEAEWYGTYIRLFGVDGFFEKETKVYVHRHTGIVVDLRGGATKEVMDTMAQIEALMKVLEVCP